MSTWRDFAQRCCIVGGLCILAAVVAVEDEPLWLAMVGGVLGNVLLMGGLDWRYLRRFR